jgi:BA14K-like protein
MKRLLVSEAGVAGLAASALLTCALLLVTGGALIAQTTGSVDPNHGPVEPSAKQDVDPPPGGCMPIGVTASGDIVFPLQCMGFIERQLGTAVREKPAATDQKRRPAGEDNPAAAAEKPPAAEEKPAAAAEKSPAAEEKPTAAAEKSPAAEEKPAAAAEKSPAAEEKPAAVEEKPPAAEEKPAAVEEKPPTKQSEAAVPENNKPADNPVRAAPFPLQKRAEQEPRERPLGPTGCTRFRTYNPVSGTYRSYDGRRRSCR